MLASSGLVVDSVCALSHVACVRKPQRSGRSSSHWPSDHQLPSHGVTRSNALARALPPQAEIRADHNAYMRDHPELKTFMSDFMAALLQRKPADVYEFANDYFGAFIKKREEEAAAAEASAEAAREAAEAAAADEGKDEDA